MNILAFGLPSPAYSFPGFDVDPAGGADRIAWILVELFGEGSMRGMFSLLSGAGLLLFTGAGLGLVGTLGRAQLYTLVPLVWLIQLWLRPWWLRRHRFGPLEYL